MAESKPIIVTNLTLFNDNRIFYHPGTKRLVSIPDSEYLEIIKKEKVRFLSDLPEYELICYFLTSDTEEVSNRSDTFVVEELEGVGYGETLYGTGKRIYFFTDKKF